MKILEIDATDKDEKDKLYYTLLSSTDILSLKKFHLDPETGFLYTAANLDHETMHKHILTVMVRPYTNYTRLLYCRFKTITDFNICVYVMLYYFRLGIKASL